MAFTEGSSTQTRLLNEVVLSYLHGERVFGYKSDLGYPQGQGELGAVMIVNLLSEIGNKGIADAGEFAKLTYADTEQAENIRKVEVWWQELYRQTDGGQDRLVVEGADPSNFSLKFQIKNEVLLEVRRQGEQLQIGKLLLDKDVPYRDLVPAIVSQVFPA
jgi:hypothetical protein